MELVIDNKKISSIFFVVFIFYLLFSPPIFGIHSMYFICAFSWVYLLFNNKYLFRLHNLETIKNTFYILLLLLAWATMWVLINDGTKSTVICYVYLLLAVFPGAMTICVHTVKIEESYLYVIKLVLYAFFVQSILSVIAFFSNDIKLMFVELLQSDDTLVMTTYTNEISYRLFGFSAGLTFDMPAAMAVAVCVALYLSISYNVKYLLFVPTMAFSAIINARTSVVVIAIGIIAFFIAQKSFTTKKLRLILEILFSILVVGFVGISVLKKISPITYDWVESGVKQIVGIFYGKADSGYFGYLNDNYKWKIPKGISLLVGTGCRVMSNSDFGFSSDIGYINDLWFGGLVYCIVIYYLTYLILKRIKGSELNVVNSEFRYFIYVLYILCLPILNIKTYIISFGSFMSLLVIIYVSTIFLATKSSDGI